MELLARYLERSERPVVTLVRAEQRRRGQRPTAGGAGQPVRLPRRQAREAASRPTPSDLTASGARPRSADPRAPGLPRVHDRAQRGLGVVLACPWTRRGRSTWRAPGGYSSSPTRPASARPAALRATSPPRTWPAPTRAASPSATSTSARSSATPTSAPSSRPSSWCDPRPSCRHDPAPEHRRRRPPQRLDVGLQRPLLAAAGVLARAVHRRAGDPLGRPWTWSRSTTWPMRFTRCARREGGVGETYHLTAGANASTIAEIAGAGQPILPPAGAASPAAGRVRGPEVRRRRGARRSRPGATYFPYFSIADRVRRRGDPGAAGAPRDQRQPPLGDYMERLLDFATRSRWGKRPIARAPTRPRA